jgi:predicted amidohydrolase
MAAFTAPASSSRATAFKASRARPISTATAAAYQDGDVLARGAALSVIDLGAVKVGVLLGYDAEFPEAFRTLALRGADLIAVALNQMEPDYGFLSAMAARNRVPLLVANRLGFRRVYPLQPEFSAGSMPLLQDKAGAFLMRCKGYSGIVDNAGARVAQPAAHTEEAAEPPPDPKLAIPIAHFQEEEILQASFNIEDLRVQRLTSPLLAERQRNLYEN